MKKISFDEFVRHVVAVFDRVVRDDEAVTVELESGERAMIRSMRSGSSTARARTDEDYAAFLASAGGWTDVDVDAYLEENIASRKLSTRPTVGL